LALINDYKLDYHVPSRIDVEALSPHCHLRHVAGQEDHVLSTTSPR
jgi:hypothetical protein